MANQGERIPHAFWAGAWDAEALRCQHIADIEALCVKDTRQSGARRMYAATRLELYGNRGIYAARRARQAATRLWSYHATNKRVRGLLK